MLCRIWWSIVSCISFSIALSQSWISEVAAPDQLDRLEVLQATVVEDVLDVHQDEGADLA
jgi:hypothetical protein